MTPIDKARALVGEWFGASPSIGDLQAKLAAETQAKMALAEQLAIACADRDRFEVLSMSMDEELAEEVIARDHVQKRAEELQARLDRIAELETPGANATVRKMARIAREEA